MLKIELEAPLGFVPLFPSGENLGLSEVIARHFANHAQSDTRLPSMPLLVDAWARVLRDACMLGGLPLKDSATGLPAIHKWNKKQHPQSYPPPQFTPDDRVVLLLDDLQRWGAENGINFLVANTQEAPPQKQLEQERAILKAITEIGLIPMALSLKAGRGGSDKSKVRERLMPSGKTTPLFHSTGVFDKAWKRLKARKEIASA